MYRRDLLTLSIVSNLLAPEVMGMEETTTLVERASDADFATTLNRLTAVIRQAGMSVFASIDHAAAARGVGLALPPTVVLFYGNPEGGTPVMLVAPRAALDLPLRVLLREGSDQRAVLSFHPIGDTLREAGVTEDMAMRLQQSQTVVLKALQA